MPDFLTIMNSSPSLSLATKEQVVEALEDSALGIAIEAGQQQDFVSEEEIMSFLCSLSAS
ncbi:MAG: hypothetical protein EAZ92_11990 [Candidatus Kapaibacterium sp.]|nr:MAG: hypothetical protein EAZ92_11990 [Candidatus Kapabacteria bacterium]